LKKIKPKSQKIVYNDKFNDPEGTFIDYTSIGDSAILKSYYSYKDPSILPNDSLAELRESFIEKVI
jgi:hypothetical protein